ncbi:winged helix DNA-binding domain-containing protein [Actinomadura sp. HBU206391]|nr:crosslink repair DNA glycosylase YcaQ family protein [Actinomadura sp. HBU206391]MBC6462430.1 winged helix DNA-binding domain-containing protein [Actinomadura sp. HBU206391]
MTDDEGLRLRARAQLLHRPAIVGVADAVRRLLAVQAQDLGGFPLALRARVPGITGADAAAARDEREVVRTWGPRGTLHLMAADDLPWLLPLVRKGPAGSLRRLRQLGVRAETGEAIRAVDRALLGQGPLTKSELGDRLARVGLTAHGQAVVHLAGLSAQAGRVVLGPDRAGRPTYVHAADWLGAPIVMETDRGRALAELARRYRRAHEPAGRRPAPGLRPGRRDRAAGPGVRRVPARVADPRAVGGRAVSPAGAPGRRGAAPRADRRREGARCLAHPADGEDRGHRSRAVRDADRRARPGRDR